MISLTEYWPLKKIWNNLLDYNKFNEKFIKLHITQLKFFEILQTHKIYKKKNLLSKNFECLISPCLKYKLNKIKD